MSPSRFIAVASSLLALVLLAAGPADAHRPLLPSSFADPTVAPYDGGLVAISTGPHAPRAVAGSLAGSWKRIEPAISRRPSWSTNAGVWAADLRHLHDRWMLYFAAPVAGLGSQGHCIGVAVAASPLDVFTPTTRPLVCPRGARAPAARDRARRRAARLPRGGVIDPSVTILHGQHYLLYKTQGIPSSIRMVPLSHDGRHVGHSSFQVLRSRRIIENPQIIAHGHRVYLFASLGTFGTCAYGTIWRSARTIAGLGAAASHPLLTARSTGVCGPGGADVVQPTRHSTQIFFSGWTCGRRAHACGPHHNYDLSPRWRSHRSLYGARLGWHHGAPDARFVTPHPAWRPLPLHRKKTQPPKKRARHHHAKHHRARHHHAKHHHARHHHARHHHAKHHHARHHHAKHHRAKHHHAKRKRHHHHRARHAAKHHRKPRATH